MIQKLDYFSKIHFTNRFKFGSGEVFQVKEQGSVLVLIHPVCLS